MIGPLLPSPQPSPQSRRLKKHSFFITCHKSIQKRRDEFARMARRANVNSGFAVDFQQFLRFDWLNGVSSGALAASGAIGATPFFKFKNFSKLMKMMIAWTKLHCHFFNWFSSSDAIRNSSSNSTKHSVHLFIIKTEISACKFCTFLKLFFIKWVNVSSLFGFHLWGANLSNLFSQIVL